VGQFPGGNGGWDRFHFILEFKSNLELMENADTDSSATFLSFRNVSFKYPNGKKYAPCELRFWKKVNPTHLWAHPGEEKQQLLRLLRAYMTL